MKEYQRLGVRLGLLVNPKNQQLEVYRLGQQVEVLNAPGSIDCGDVIPGFMLSLSRFGSPEKSVTTFAKKTVTELRAMPQDFTDSICLTLFNRRITS